jgi:DNA-binding transcriptional MerR regulator
MNEFSIRDIENLCGIKAHTLRMWEQRYQLHIPRRNAGNHRYYDNEDLKYLLRIAFLYHNGHKISRLALLDEKEISRLALMIPPSGGADEIFINHLIEASLDFDQDLFDRILHNIILHMGFEKAIPRVVYPFLEKIGLLWMTGNVVPAQEHFASALIIKKLLVATAGLEDPCRPDPRKFLLFTPEGEFHEIPLLYMRYRMKRLGMYTIYFGRNASLEELRYYGSQRPFTHLYFHLVTQLLRHDPVQYIQKLVEMFPDRQIIVSGNIGAAGLFEHAHVRLLKDQEEMENFVRGN